MVKLCSWNGFGIRHYRGLSTDITTLDVEASNGDEFYCMDTQDVYMYDEENKKWLKQ